MHDFLKAVGFSQIKTMVEYKEILKKVMEEPTEVFMSSLKLKSPFGGMGKSFSENMGLMVYGSFTPEAELEPEYSFPYLKGRTVTMIEHISVEKRACEDAYMGIYDDEIFQYSLVFQILNMKDYVEYSRKNDKILPRLSVRMSALALSGKVILPIRSYYEKDELHSKKERHRNKMISKARQGDPAAVEYLTLESFDIDSEIMRRARHEDVLSIVESYIIPYGIEYDQYSIMGTILSAEIVENSCSKEKIWLMKVDCKGLVMDVCINENDLMGEPLPGRRFRGNVCLQGVVDFGC